MRITKKELQTYFNIFVQEMNKEQKYTINNNGGWLLDYAACYGGYVIEQQEGNGCISHPLGIRRRSLKDMHLALEFAIEALRLKQRNTEQCNAA
jgi:galactokinase/mevalonate kinase-like predicted kinase